MLGKDNAPPRSLRENLPPPHEFRLEAVEIPHGLGFGHPSERKTERRLVGKPEGFAEKTLHQTSLKAPHKKLIGLPKGFQSHSPASAYSKSESSSKRPGTGVSSTFVRGSLGARSGFDA